PGLAWGERIVSRNSTTLSEFIARGNSGVSGTSMPSATPSGTCSEYKYCTTVVNTRSPDGSTCGPEQPTAWFISVSFSAPVLGPGTGGKPPIICATQVTSFHDTSLDTRQNTAFLRRGAARGADLRPKSV